MKLNTKIIFPSILILAVLTFVIIKVSSDNATPEPSNLENTSTTKHERTSDKTHPPKIGSLDPETKNSGTNHTLPKGDQTANKETILGKIQDASITYDAAYLPVIKPYLLNSDPEIRKEAVNAMVILGDSAGGPMLREAAKQMSNAEDMKAMLEAAEFLELPPANLKEILKKNKAAKAPEPSDK